MISTLNVRQEFVLPKGDSVPGLRNFFLEGNNSSMFPVRGA